MGRRLKLIFSKLQLLDSRSICLAVFFLHLFFQELNAHHYVFFLYGCINGSNRASHSAISKLFCAFGFNLQSYIQFYIQCCDICLLCLLMMPLIQNIHVSDDLKFALTDCKGESSFALEALAAAAKVVSATAKSKLWQYIKEMDLVFSVAITQCTSMTFEYLVIFPLGD